MRNITKTKIIELYKILGIGHGKETDLRNISNFLTDDKWKILITDNTLSDRSGKWETGKSY